MEKIDRELLIKEISSRLPYGIKAKVLGWDEEKGEIELALRVYSINTDGYVYFESNDYDVNYLPVEDCLLFLRPMSSMTEEEKEELNKYVFSEKGLRYFWFDDGIMYSGPDNQCFIGIGNDTIDKMVDWLNKKMFDYRGLIPLGLGIDCTGLNIY